MREVTVSVAMATYNGARHIAQQLDSLAAQTRRPDELIVCDDGSEDGTAAIVEAFAATAPFAVRLRRNAANLGVLRNFEKAIAACSGSHIFLSDQDDVWLPDKIERMMIAFGGGRPVVINDKIIVDADLAPTGATMLGNIRGFGSPDSNFVAGCCSAFTREWRDLVLPIPPGPPAHDSWIIGLAHRLGAVRIVEEPLQLYRRHAENASQNAYSADRRIGLSDRIGAELGGIGRSQRDYWATFIGWHAAEMDRLRERRDVLAALGLADAAEGALATLAALTRAERERARIGELPRLRRAAPVVRLLAHGGYAHFSGWKSAAKDLVQ